MTTYSTKQRSKLGTIKRAGSKGKTDFPIGDKTHAILAVGAENRANPPISATQKATINRKAAQFGVGPDAKKSAKKSTK